MPRPALTEYLLKLSTDQAEFDRFRSSRGEATQSMKDAGLTEEHQEIVLRANSTELEAAVTEELATFRPEVARGGGNQPMVTTTLRVPFQPPLVTHPPGK